MPPASVPAAAEVPAPPATEPTTATAEARCDEAAKLAAAGDHKPAVDLWNELRASDLVCPEPVAAAVEASRRTLAKADELARQGLEQRDAGDRQAARGSFQAALELYPRYYWVQKLLALEEASAALSEADSAPPVEDPDEIAARELEWARLAQREGQSEAAFLSVRRAIVARPTGELSAEVVEFARLLGVQLFAAGQLVRARDLWADALTLDAGNQALEEFLAEVESRLEKLKDLQDE